MKALITEIMGYFTWLEKEEVQGLLRQVDCDLRAAATPAAFDTVLDELRVAACYDTPPGSTIEHAYQIITKWVDNGMYREG